MVSTRSSLKKSGETLRRKRGFLKISTCEYPSLLPQRTGNWGPLRILKTKVKQRGVPADEDVPVKRSLVFEIVPHKSTTNSNDILEPALTSKSTDAFQ